MILGQPALNTFQEIVSTYHMMIKFPVGTKVGELKCDQYTARKFYVEAIRGSSGRMDVDPPSKESSQISTQHGDQNDTIPVHVQLVEELLSIHLTPRESARIPRLAPSCVLL
ncbi:UNVERIFIED_CONTAM: hypothetical protein Sradi_4910500 [Sesamum radiatum]|uniref:SNF2 N-terminal domain-containing protein n=1 Tax=Sesamum radiatum TaxID=300843 RepID=A0AAW2MDZ3_SESRA